MNDRRPDVHALQTGRSIDVEGIGRITLTTVSQRNWSRVAVAERGHEKFFVKQFIDRVGRPHPRGFVGDRETYEQLPAEISGRVRVVPVITYDESLLVAVSPFIEMSTLDSIGRVRPEHAAIATRIGEALAAIIDDRRLPNDPERVAVWKGLDPKNIGWAPDGGMWIFDFGPPSVVDVGTAASRAMAAGLLSRWLARPGLHLIRPERTILRGVCAPLVPYTTLESVEKVLHDQEQLRLREPQRTRAAATITRLGLRTVGRVHWAIVRREARQMFASA